VFDDDLHILQTIDRLKQAGRIAYLFSGIDLLRCSPHREVTGCERRGFGSA
jgi:hypothetical protein